MKTDAGDMAQIDEIIRRVRWLEGEFNFKGFNDITQEQKRKILEELVDRIVIDGNNYIEVRLKLPSPKLVETIASLSMHNTTCRMTSL
jgi:hypothetical protein